MKGMLVLALVLPACGTSGTAGGGGGGDPTTTVIIGPGADASSPDKFGGASDGGRAPSLVYPTDGTLVPPNLTRMEFQFRPGAGNTLFRLTYEGATVRLEIYLGCQALGDGCVYAPPEEVWALIGPAEKGQAQGSWFVSGVNGASPGAVGHSPSFRFGVGQEDIVGGLYYWTAGAGKIMRYDFGLATARAEVFVDPVREQAGECVGCHALSRDGKKIAFATATDDASGANHLFDVATRSPLFSTPPRGPGMNLFAFHPDGTQLLLASESSIAWLDAASGAVLDDALVEGGTMPDWSADASRMVYATSSCSGGDDCEDYGVEGASLMTRPFQGSGFGSASTLVSGGNNYYPAFSPDGTYVLYNHAASGHSYDNQDAEVHVVPAAGGSSVRLLAASPGGDSWPKWAPVVQDYRGGRRMWFTFSSRRPVGLRTSPRDEEGLPVAQIWMASFDPDRAAAGADPSTAAFWLPFQEAGSGNHIAQWTTEVERESCGDASDCETDELCENGRCLPALD